MRSYTSMIQKWLIFCPKWIFCLGKLPMPLVLSQTVELSSQTLCDILDPCWEFVVELYHGWLQSLWCGSSLKRDCYSTGAPPHTSGISSVCSPISGMVVSCPLGMSYPAPWDGSVLLEICQSSSHWYCICLTSISTVVLLINLLHYWQLCSNLLHCIDTWMLLLCWLLV